ncbi:MAG: molybdate ABC transporter substrate-binding protein [Spirochaetes bacterium]|nr:molybdate ABC transporter substrate-binding protein [Spirochaetota bacterium]
MKKTLFLFVVMSVWFFLPAGQVYARGARAADGNVELLVGAAMSLRDVAEELGAAYTAQNPDVTITFTFASSGALQSQIEAGAPIDIFMSAAVGQMRNLEGQGLIHGSGRNVVTNTVALIVPVGSPTGITGFADVTDASIGLIGLGDPVAMPIGTFAHDIFTALGIADEVYARAVLASEVRQLLTWVELGEVDAGVVFMTDAITSDLVRVVEVADSVLHTPSINPVGVVSASGHIAQAQSFVDFLFTSQARAIFEQHGFSMYQ